MKENVVDNNVLKLIFKEIAKTTRKSKPNLNLAQQGQLCLLTMGDKFTNSKYYENTKGSPSFGVQYF